MKAKVGEINLGTVGGSQAITGVGFIPKIVFFWGTRFNSTSGAQFGTGTHFFGAAISSTSRRVVAFANATGSDSYAMQEVTKCGFVPRSAPGSNPKYDWLVDLTSMDADGFTISKTLRTGGTTNVKINYLALGGDDLANVFVGQFTEPGATGDQGVTGVGFQPTLVIPFSAMIANTGTFNDSDSGHMVGVGNADSEAVLAAKSNSLANPTVAKSYSRIGDFIALIDASAGSIDARATLKTLDSDGFTVNWSSRASTREIFFAALRITGRTATKIGSLQTKTDGSNIVVTGVGGKPEALLFGSHNKTFSGAGSLSADHKVSIGAANSATDRGANAGYHKDNYNPSSETDMGNGHDPAEVYINLTGINTCTIEALMDLVSLDGDGLTAVMDDVETSVADVWFLAVYSPSIFPGGIASAEAFGATEVIGPKTIGPNGLASAESVPSPTVVKGLYINPTSGIPSAGAFGTAQLSLKITPAGIASAEFFEFPSKHDPEAPGIFHTNVPRKIIVSAAGPSSAAAVGTPRLQNGPFVGPIGIPSSEAFGVAFLGMRLIGIASVGAVGSPSLRQDLILGSTRLFRTKSKVTAEVQ